MSSDNANLHQTVSECRTATHNLLRETQQFSDRLELLDENRPTAEQIAGLELQRVTVDESHSRYVHVTTLLFELLRRT